MSNIKNVNEKSVIKEDQEYLISLHNAISKAIIDHDRNDMNFNVSLLKKKACVERMLLRNKNILAFGVHDKSLLEHVQNLIPHIPFN